MALDGPGKTAVGIILQILATFLAALAYVWQKQAHLNSQLPGAPAASSSWLWRAGLGLMVLVAVVDIYSFSLLDQSTLGAFGAATLAWNVILAYFILKEELTRLTLVSVVLISIGTVVAVSSSSTSQDFTLPAIVALSEQPRVFVWCILNAAGIAFAAYTLERASATPAAARGSHYAGRLATFSFSVPYDVLFSVVSPITGGMCMGCVGRRAGALSGLPLACLPLPPSRPPRPLFFRTPLHAASPGGAPRPCRRPFSTPSGASLRARRSTASSSSCRSRSSCRCAT